MKAIVMAGGEGTRLRPVTADMPKPMAPILGRSVLEHMLRLLRREGVDRALLTLGYMAGEIESWAETQPVEGMEIICRRETMPLGTAGGVRAAADWLDGEDFLVVSGDAVCDLELHAAMEERRRRSAAAVLVLTGAADPGEYGSVLTDEDGHIQSFLEKPRADSVATDRINTGIYALSPAVLEGIPAGVPCDFGRDVFPELLRRDAALYGLTLEGYWCDIGSIPAYLGCCRDALLGRIRLEPAAPLQRPGIWSFEAPPERVTLLPPLYLGRNVSLEQGAVIGPGAVLEDGSSAAAGARVTNSVVMGAALRRGAAVSGSWLGRGAVVGERAIVSDGCAVGSGAVAGACSLLEPGTRLWPRRDVPQGERVSGSFEDRPVRGPLRFQAGGLIQGEWNAQITPEACFALGCAAAEIGDVSLAADRGGAAQLVQASLACGIRAGGSDAAETDADQEFAAARNAFEERHALSVYVREKAGRILISFYGPDGRQIPRELERKLEAGAAGSLRIAAAERTGRLLRQSGVPERLAKAAGAGIKHGAAVSVAGNGAEAALLRRALGLAGIPETEGAAVLCPEEGGFTLTGQDEEGMPFYARDGFMLALLARLEAGQRRLALPEWAPQAAEKLLSRYDAERLSPEESDKQPPDGALFLAADIVSAMAGRSLCELRRMLPDYAVAECELPVRFGAAALRRIREERRDMSWEARRGLELRGEGRSARLQQVAGGLRIAAEAADMEAAQELCDSLRQLAQRCDRP